uniref:Ig-like domain-containing protein n=1 Tax=Nothobranchius furzeri TaxID=105023 RepID=A0A8C6NPF9_NOTFU
MTAKAPKFKAGVSTEPPALSGCGLQGSAAIIKVSQIKQAFESDSPDLISPPSPEGQRKQTHFPEEFIPPVAVSLNQQEEKVAFGLYNQCGYGSASTINPCSPEAPETVELYDIGKSLSFAAEVFGLPSPDVRWFCNKTQLVEDDRIRIERDGDSISLVVHSVTKDSGVYTCRAINPVGETLCRASLVVLNAKAFSGKTRGRELTAVSLGSAKVQPQKFDLMVGNTSFDGEQVSEIELDRCIIQEKSAGHFNLLITNVIQSDAGEYKCIIQNSAGRTETAALLKVF